MCRAYFAELFLREDAPRFLARGGEWHERVALYTMPSPRVDEDDERLRVFPYPDAEALEGDIPVRTLRGTSYERIREHELGTDLAPFRCLHEQLCCCMVP